MESATISDMPCNVLDNILGSLPLKDAVKTSILSKDWRYKWVTRAILDFSGEFFTFFNDNQEAKTFIYQILRLHQGPILKFTLIGPNLMSCPDIDHWMLILSTKNVQELILHIPSGSDYHSPSHLFTFQQLRHLVVRHCLFQPPTNFKGFAQLINLNLHQVIFGPEMFLNVISKSPFLETLRLTRCTGFDILEIDAANLKRFDFFGETKSICFKSAPMLKRLFVWLTSRVRMDPSHICSNLTKFFHYMPSLQELELSGSTLEFMIMGGGIPESPPTALDNVKSLCLFDMSFINAEGVSGAVYLITSCPKLQKLTIECEIGDIVEEPIVPVFQAKSILCGVFKVLQRVKMCYFTGFEMEMEFVKFILASAPVLEEIYFLDIGNFLRGTEMMDEMKQFPRASPNVRFKFKDISPDSEMP